MGETATTVEDQIELLERRGMIISNKDKAKEHLLDIGYYRLGFYWHYFEKDDEHNFQQDTTLDDAINLYYLDMDLRNLLSRYIFRIEVHFRTQVIYYISNQYPNTPIWYIDKEICGLTLDSFKSKIYKNLKEKNPHIIRHHEKHPKDHYAPAWKTLEFLTFGQILHVFNNVRNEDVKDGIANVYGLQSIISKQKTGKKTVKAFQRLYDYLVAILNIRNICSHSSVLFDYKQKKGIRRIPDHRFRTKFSNQTDLRTSINLVLFMLSKISMNRVKDLEKDLNEVINEAVEKNKKLKKIIIDHMGFEL